MEVDDSGMRLAEGQAWGCSNEELFDELVCVGEDDPWEGLNVRGQSTGCGSATACTPPATQGACLHAFMRRGARMRTSPCGAIMTARPTACPPPTHPTHHGIMAW